MEPRKEIISFKALEQEIVATEKYKQIYFDVSYPENREEILARLSKINIPSQIPELPITPTLKDILEKYRKLIDQAKYEEISLPQCVDQIYNKVFINENIAQIKKALDNAFRENKISIQTHFEFSRFFHYLQESKNYLEERSKVKDENAPGIESKQTDQISEQQHSNHLLSLEKYFSHSGITKYLTETLDAGLSKELPEWHAFAKQRNTSISYDLAVGNALKSFGTPIMPFYQRTLAQRHIKKEAVDALPKENAHYTLASKYSNLNIYDFNEWVAFFNENYEQLPTQVKENISQSIMSLKLAPNNKPISSELVHFVVPTQIESKGSVALVNESYDDVHHNTQEFLLRNITHYQSGGHLLTEESKKLLNYMNDLIINNPDRKNKYILAFIQNIIEKTYQGNAASDGVYWVNNQITKILQDKSLSNEAQTALVEVALELLLKLTDPALIFGNTVYNFMLPDYYKPDHTRSTFPAQLREYFIDAVGKQNPAVEKQVQHIHETRRSAVVQDLLVKEHQYFSDLIDLVPNKKFSMKNREREFNILIRRLAAGNYVKTKCNSQDAISGKDLEAELTALFGPLTFATRQIRDSHIKKVVKDLVIPAMNFNKQSFPAKQGLFPQQVENNNSAVVETKPETLSVKK